MKLLQGIKLSYTLQKILQQGQRNKVVRGSRSKDGELPSALNGFLYSILKNTKAQRRGILTSLLKQFEEHAVSRELIGATAVRYLIVLLQTIQC